MSIKEEREENKVRAGLHTGTNVNYLFIAFTAFTFIATINQDLLRNNLLMTIQLVLSIPMFMSSILARAKLSEAVHTKTLRNFGSFCFITGYAFLINTVGILVGMLVSDKIGILFFAVNILMALAYSYIQIKLDLSRIKRRIIKDGYFILIIILLGLLPILKIY